MTFYIEIFVPKIKKEANACRGSVGGVGKTDFVFLFIYLSKNVNDTDLKNIKKC